MAILSKVIGNIKTVISPWFYQKSEVDSKLNSKAEANHTHSISGVSNLQSSLDGKADSGHNHDERYYTESELDAKFEVLESALDGLVGFTATVVASLPSSGENGVMYLVLNEEGIERDVYNEYIWVNGGFEKIGNTSVEVDLSGYATVSFVNSSLADYALEDEVTSALNGKSDVGHTHSVADISSLQSLLDGKADEGHTHSLASTGSNGFMSSTDKSKLDGIATGANKTTVDSSLSSSSANPVQNKVVTQGLNGKSDSDHTHTVSDVTNLGVASTSGNGLMSSAMVTKLNGIATGANKTTVDSALSSTSTNPVQNKVVKAQVDSLNSAKANTNHTHNDYTTTTAVSCSYGTVKKFKKNGWAVVVWQDLNLTNISKNAWVTIANVGWTNQGEFDNHYGNFFTPNQTIPRFEVTQGGLLRAFIPSGCTTPTGNYGYIVYPTAD